MPWPNFILWFFGSGTTWLLFRWALHWVWRTP